MPTIDVLYFSAPWCAPCKRLAPVMDKLAHEFPAITFKKINVDDEREAVEQHQIRGVPTLVVLRDGAKVDTIVGLESESELRATFTAFVES